MVKRGFHSFMTYVLYNYKDTPEDFYYRLRESVRLRGEIGGYAIDSFPMRYQPIMEIDPARKYVDVKWTLRKRNAFVTIRSFHSFNGEISMNGGGIFKNPMEEFEYWFGKDAKDFNNMLAYPELRQLLKRKSGALRLARARGEKVK